MSPARCGWSSGRQARSPSSRRRPSRSRRRGRQTPEPRSPVPLAPANQHRPGRRRISLSSFKVLLNTGISGAISHGSGYVALLRPVQPQSIAIFLLAYYELPILSTIWLLLHFCNRGSVDKLPVRWFNQPGNGRILALSLSKGGERGTQCPQGVNPRPEISQRMGRGSDLSTLTRQLTPHATPRAARIAVTGAPAAIGSAPPPRKARHGEGGVDLCVTLRIGQAVSTSPHPSKHAPCALVTSSHARRPPAATSS